MNPTTAPRPAVEYKRLRKSLERALKEASQAAARRRRVRYCLVEQEHVDRLREVHDLAWTLREMCHDLD